MNFLPIPQIRSVERKSLPLKFTYITTCFPLELEMTGKSEMIVKSVGKIDFMRRQH